MEDNLVFSFLLQHLGLTERTEVKFYLPSSTHEMNSTEKLSHIYKKYT